MSIVRYEKSIQAMLDIEQKRIEIRRLIGVVKDNLTVSEYTYDMDDVNGNHLKLAFSRITSGQVNISDKNRHSTNYESPVIMECNYVTSQIVYKDVSISLHSNVKSNPREALRHIIKEFK